MREPQPAVRLPGSSRCGGRSEEHTSELQSRFDLVCRLLLEKKKGSFVYHDRSLLTSPSHDRYRRTTHIWNTASNYTDYNTDLAVQHDLRTCHRRPLALLRG